MGRLRRLDVIRKGKRIRLLCISICVRNKNLLGATGSGIDGVSERQQFLLQLVSRYSPLFALEVFSAVALSDALLVHLELRPDWARMWSKEELLRRAWEAFPNLVKEYCRERNIEFDPQQGPPEVLLTHRRFLKKMRKRLQSLSLFFQLIKQISALKFNREDKVRGHFWAERFEAIPVTDKQFSVLMSLLAESQPVVMHVVSALEQPHTSSGWWRLLEGMLTGGIEVDAETQSDVVRLSERVRAFFGRDVLWLRARRRRQEADTHGPEGDVQEAQDANLDEAAVEASQAPPASTEAHSDAEASRAEASSSQLPAGAERVGKVVQGPIPMLVLGLVDSRECSPEEAEEGETWQARGIGPLNEVEWAHLLGWIGATWCAWRLIKPEDQDVEFDRKRYRNWREGGSRLKMRELTEREQQAAQQRLIEWLTEWAAVCQVPGLATEEQRVQWAMRLVAARATPEELADVVGELLGLSVQRKVDLQAALARVQLSINRIVEAGELWRVDLVRGARELLGLREWVARRRAMLRGERHEPAESGASSQSDSSPPTNSG
ncbi:MAG: hypothetical protein KatS3mg109_0701 [Pirellulaceae bacterium]|nr:MAG: hypothetical protein KatS3mg109_0701 [Pirellulaceae bacterium]